jgi:hypothetical protein
VKTREQIIIATTMLFTSIVLCGAVSADESNTTIVTPLNSNGHSEYPSISDDGNWIAYHSIASNQLLVIL